MNAMMVGHRERGGTTRSLGVRVAYWIILGLIGWYTLGPAWVTAMRPPPRGINDYYQDWASSRNYWVGMPAYAPHSTSVPQHLGLPSNPNKSIEYNSHPPVSVLLALPLGRLAYADAVLVWNVLSIAAFAVGLWVLAATLPVPRSRFLLVLAMLPFCQPLCVNLAEAQLSLVLVSLMMASWALERSGWSRTAGALLGLAAAIKLFPAYLVFYLAGRRRWRALLAAAATVVALSLAAAMVLGIRAWDDYLHIVLPDQARFRSMAYNLAIVGFWHKLFDPTAEINLTSTLFASRTLAIWGALLSDLAVTAIVATVAYRRGPRSSGTSPMPSPWWACSWSRPSPGKPRWSSWRCPSRRSLEPPRGLTGSRRSCSRSWRS